MRTAYRCLIALAAVVALAAIAAPAPATGAGKVSVLIIDGQNGHDWKATTPAIKEMLEKTGRFTVDVLTSPPSLPKNADDAAKAANKAAWEKFKPDFSKCQAVLSNYCGQPWPEDVQKAFEKYVADGGGFVAYHFAVAAFAQWDAYNKMIGIGWARDAKTAGGIAMDDGGKVVLRAAGEGLGGHHGAAHQFPCTVRNAEHPITKGVPAKWVHISDELYASLRGPAKDMQILVTALSSKDDAAWKGTGMNEPVAWTVPFGKGRVFVTVLGHHVIQTAAPDAAILLERGTEWAATGAVTIAAPKEFPPPPEVPAPAKK